MTPARRNTEESERAYARLFRKEREAAGLREAEGEGEERVPSFDGIGCACACARVFLRVRVFTCSYVRGFLSFPAVAL